MADNQSKSQGQGNQGNQSNQGGQSNPGQSNPGQTNPGQTGQKSNKEGNPSERNITATENEQDNMSRKEGKNDQQEGGSSSGRDGRSK